MLNEKFYKALKRASINLQKQIKEQEARERADPPGRVRLEPPGIFWNIFAKQVWVRGEKKPCVELSWGWTACLSDKQIENIADDTPKGHDSLIITEDIAKELLTSLTKILKAVPPS